MGGREGIQGNTDTTRKFKGHGYKYGHSYGGFGGHGYKYGHSYGGYGGYGKRSADSGEDNIIDPAESDRRIADPEADAKAGFGLGGYGLGGLGGFGFGGLGGYGLGGLGLGYGNILLLDVTDEIIILSCQDMEDCTEVVCMAVVFMVAMDSGRSIIKAD